MMKELEKYDTNCLSLEQAERKSIITELVEWSIKSILDWRSVQKCLKYHVFVVTISFTT